MSLQYAEGQGAPHSIETKHQNILIMAKFLLGGVLCGTAKFRTPTTIIIIFKLVTKPNMVEFVILGPSMAKVALSWVARQRVVGQKVQTKTTDSRSEQPQETVGERDGLDCCPSRPEF